MVLLSASQFTPEITIGKKHFLKIEGEGTHSDKVSVQRNELI
jgi:hypothetical protein